jgi:hypothetical protein
MPRTRSRRRRRCRRPLSVPTAINDPRNRPHRTTQTPEQRTTGRSSSAFCGSLREFATRRRPRGRNGLAPRVFAAPRVCNGPTMRLRVGRPRGNEAVLAHHDPGVSARSYIGDARRLLTSDGLSRVLRNLRILSGALRTSEDSEHLQGLCLRCSRLEFVARKLVSDSGRFSGDFLAHRRRVSTPESTAATRARCPPRER